ncbi:plasmid mobilization relaxosome protein MobC [Glaciimonas sp. CA11.2]|nr:plasmid mobilization relaxosome protein MobC [Glaciimonas sp. CA11.2]MDY7545068.1 plasmid mobilization relaxosome protein MobC [Glaciimonas sp. CA11.2]
MARPNKRQDEKLTKTVAFRLGELDFKMYQEKFNQSGLTQSEFFRRHILTVASSTAKSNDSGRAAILLLSITSNRLNQIAHHLQSEYQVGKINANTFQQLVTQLEILNRFAYHIAVGRENDH